MGVNSLPKTVTRKRRDCDMNPGPSAPESNALTTRLPSHPSKRLQVLDAILDFRPAGLCRVSFSVCRAVRSVLRTVKSL